MWVINTRVGFYFYNAYEHICTDKDLSSKWRGSIIPCFLNRVLVCPSPASSAPPTNLLIAGALTGCCRQLRGLTQTLFTKISPQQALKKTNTWTREHEEIDENVRVSLQLTWLGNLPTWLSRVLSMTPRSSNKTRWEDDYESLWTWDWGRSRGVVKTSRLVNSNGQTRLQLCLTVPLSSLAVPHRRLNIEYLDEITIREVRSSRNLTYRPLSVGLMQAGTAGKHPLMYIQHSLLWPKHSTNRCRWAEVHWSPLCSWSHLK